jgi:hypothetical protein
LLQPCWQEWPRAKPELNTSNVPSVGKTITFAEALLRDVFGFTDITRVGSRAVDERLYSVTLEGLSGRAPIVVVPPSDNLDRASDHLPTDWELRVTRDKQPYRVLSSRHPHN